MSNDEDKISRREFVKFSAVASASAGGLYALTARTDALGQGQPITPSTANLGVGNGSSAYTYAP